MTTVRVAVLAQVRRALDEQARLRRAMRRMAVQAVLANRLMFPQYRATLLGVTVVAGLVDREFFQQLRTWRAVRVVAVGADDLALANRVMRELEAVGTLFRVTGEAFLRLGELHQD